MNYYMDFDPYPMIRQRNEEMLREVHSLRLGERLQAKRGPWRVHRSWLVRLAAAVGRS